MIRLSAALLAATLLAGLACSGKTQDASIAPVRLITEPPRGKLSPGTLGSEVPVLDGSYGEGAWTPLAAGGSWRIEGGSLVVETKGAPFDLERPVAFSAADLDAPEVTLASEYKVRLSLSWQRQGEGEGDDRPPVWVETGMVLEFPEGRGDLHLETFVFDLRTHSGWTRPISRLRLRLDPEREREKLVIRKLRGFRMNLSPEVLSEPIQDLWWVEIDHDLRRALVVAPGHPIDREIVVPDESILQFDIGAFAGQQIRLRVESRGQEGLDSTLGFPVWANPEIVPVGREMEPNILLISIDTLRADHLSLHSYLHAPSPRIDKWAQSSALTFANVVAHSPWTLPQSRRWLEALGYLD